MKLVNTISDNKTQGFLEELDVPKVKTAITEHVHKYCPHCHDDPQTGATDQCCKFSDDIHDTHCIAIDSPCSYIENGTSLCNIFNTFPPVDGLQVSLMSGKVCAYCHKRFKPNSNRQKYCTSCTGAAARIADNKRHRKHRSNHGKQQSMVKSHGLDILQAL